MVMAATYMLHGPTAAEWLSLMVTFMNGVEFCPVSCLSNFSLVSTLLAKSIVSLRLFTLIKVT